MRFSSRSGSVFLLSLISLLLIAAFAAGLPDPVNDPIARITQRISKEVLTRGKAYSNLVELTSKGHRLSGSSGADEAVRWSKTKMSAYGFDRIWMQPVRVPRWSRGGIELATVKGFDPVISLQVAALGNSVGTGPHGIEGEVIEVQGLKEVESLGTKVRGKIVFYNRKMDPSLRDTFEAYGGAVDQRTSGAAVAAKYGAVGVLVRSLTTLPNDDHPHTGVLHYKPNIPEIPAAALSTRSANELSDLLRKHSSLRVKLELSAQSFAWVQSFNVVGEIRGREKPDEYVLVGGHLDSWDLATGAHDDGAGVVQSLEVLRCFKALRIRPKRSVRVVLFMAEEFGAIGGVEYARQVQLKKESHIAAIESDRGGFGPTGFTLLGHPELLEKFRSWSPYLAPIHADQIIQGESGADVEPLDPLGVPTLGFLPDTTHYFDFHHSALDRIEAVPPADLNAGAAAMAILTYLIAEEGLQ